MNEKHDVLIAEGMKWAIVEEDVSQDMVKENKIPGISLLNNFQLTDKRGIRVWPVYDIGPGCLLKYCDLQLTPQSDTTLKIIEPFGELAKEKGIVEESSKMSADVYSYQKCGCVLPFSAQQEGGKHMDTGNGHWKWATRVRAASKCQQAVVSDINQESQGRWQGVRMSPRRA